MNLALYIQNQALHLEMVLLFTIITFYNNYYLQYTMLFYLVDEEFDDTHDVFQLVNCQSRAVTLLARPKPFH